MKTLQKSLSFLLILSLLCSGLLVRGVDGADDFDFVLQEGKAIVTWYSGESVNVVVPDTLGGAPVTEINVDTFFGNEKIKSVTLPDSLTETAPEQFAYCTSLEEIHFGKNFTTLGNATFWTCTALKSIVIPDSVTSLGIGAFRDCAALETVTIGKGVTTLPGDLFDMCTALHTVYCGENVTEVNDNAFPGCFDNGGDLYVFAKTTVFPTKVLGYGFLGTIHCFNDSPIYAAASDMYWEIVTFDETGIEVTLDAPLSVTVSDTAQAVPTQGVHVWKLFRDSTNASAVLPKVDVTASSMIPETMVFDTVGTASVPVSENGFTASYNVTVNVPVIETGIRVAASPANTLYYVSDAAQTVDTTGLSVYLQFSDGHEEDVTADCTVNSTQYFAGEGLHAVAVRYGSFTTAFNVTVRKADLKLSGGSLIKKKIGLFSSYKKNPVQLTFSGMEPELVASVRWQVKEGKKFSVDQNGKVTYSKISAGTGVIELTVTDIHGAEHTAQTRIIFHRFNLQLPILFSRYL